MELVLLETFLSFRDKSDVYRAQVTQQLSVVMFYGVEFLGIRCPAVIRLHESLQYSTAFGMGVTNGP